MQRNENKKLAEVKNIWSRDKDDEELRHVP